MTWTTYCMRHNALETVEGVDEVRPFVVQEAGLLWPRGTNRSACDVRGFTDKGCKVHFIGGTQWNR